TATRTGRSAVVSPCAMTDGPETSNHRVTSPRLMRTRPPGRLRRAGPEAHSNPVDADEPGGQKTVNGTRIFEPVAQTGCGRLGKIGGEELAVAIVMIGLRRRCLRQRLRRFTCSLRRLWAVATSSDSLLLSSPLEK